MNNLSKSEAYAAAGVDITAGYRAVELMKRHIAATVTSGVCSDVGGFGGLFELDLTGIQKPVLVSGTDGVGTKLKLAFLMDKHDTVGIDCVAMCVNDIICCGAKPLFFLDYIACGKNVPERIEQIVQGVCEGCIQAGAALIGGETAEMPGFYPEDEYDLAGYSTGVVDKDRIIRNETMQEGDVILALPSSGVHSNGQRFFPCAEGFRRGALRSDGPRGGAWRKESWSDPAHAHADLRQACSDPGGAGKGQGYFPYHRRRILREHSPFHSAGPLRPDPRGGRARAAHF